MPIPETQQGNVGTVLRIPFLKQDGRTAEDLTGFQRVEIRIDPPAGPTRVRDAVVYGAATLGLVDYPTAPGDLSAFGTYRAQGVAYFADEAPLYSGVRTFEVKPNLGLPTLFLLPPPAVVTVSAPIVTRVGGA